MYSVKILASEIASLHAAWPSTGIVVVGHSYGGLVAETWWYDEHPGNGGHCVAPTGGSGVAHVFSLDSPINGVRRCATAANRATPLAPHAAADTWCALWGGDSDHGVTNGKRIAAIDDKEHSFTAVGTPHDPTYGNGFTGGDGDLWDPLVYRCFDSADENDPGAPCIDRTGVPLPVSYPSVLSRCNGDTGNIYGSAGHDIVKACPPVIQLIANAIGEPVPSYSAAAVPVPSSGGAVPTGAPTVVKRFEPWVAVRQNGGFAPAPGLTVTNGGTATCDEGSANDGGSASAVRCMPPGNGAPCFVYMGGGDPGNPLLCSNDPTSSQVIEVKPGGNGIPTGMLNHDDPTAPPWFLILADGRRCRANGYGTDTNILLYDCGGMVGATVPDRSQPTWTVREGTDPFKQPSSPPVAVVTAYR